MQQATRKPVSAKNAEAISILMNSYLCAEIMVDSFRQKQDWDGVARWKANRLEAAEQLFEKFGIWIAGETKDRVR